MDRVGVYFSSVKSPDQGDALEPMLQAIILKGGSLTLSILERMPREGVSGQTLKMVIDHIIHHGIQADFEVIDDDFYSRMRMLNNWIASRGYALTIFDADGGAS